MDRLPTLHVPLLSASDGEKTVFAQDLAALAARSPLRVRLVVEAACPVAWLLHQLKNLRHDGKLVVEIEDRGGIGADPRVRRAVELVGAKLLSGDMPEDTTQPDEAVQGEWTKALNVMIAHAEGAPAPPALAAILQTAHRPRVLGSFPPRLLLLDVARGCNQACRYCFQDMRRPPAFALDRLERQLDVALDNGFRHVVLTGGELFCHPEWRTLVKRVSDGRFSGWGIFTNGTQLADAGVLDYLMEQGMGLCQISFDSPDPQVQNALSRNPRTFERLEAAFAALGRCEGVDVILCAVVTSETLAGLPGYPEYIASVRERTGLSPTLSFAAMLPVSGDHAALAAPVSAVAAQVRPLLDACTRLGFESMYRHIPLCLMPDREMSATDLYVHNVLFGEDGAVRPLSDKADIAACLPCPLKARCPGLTREYVRLHGSAEIRVSPYV